MSKEFNLKAGAAAVDITPRESHFLHGYPFVERMSTGTHDPLLSSALYITDGREQVLFISIDVIYLNKESVARVRQNIAKETGVPVHTIMVATTHTHSGPVTVDLVISENEPIIPKVDKEYLKQLEQGIAESARKAFENAVPAEITFQVGDATGVGTNRHDPAGPKDMDVPVMAVRNTNGEYIACMLVCAMHPTVLHEDSTLYSGDFPHFVREALQQDLLGEGCPVVYFTGVAGNQSPRHVTKANTFEEARRLGTIVAETVKVKLLENSIYTSEVSIHTKQKYTDLPRRQFPTVKWAEQHCRTIKERFEYLKKNSSDPRETRTAEVNWFGAEELLFLAKKNESGSLDEAYQACLPAEIQVVKIGPWSFVAWPGEVFVEFALKLKKQFKNIALITYANGELQGYITTKEAVDKGFYEAGNSFFSYQGGEILVDKTAKLLKELEQ